MYFLYLLKILLHLSTSKFGSGIHISMRLFSGKPGHIYPYQPYYIIVWPTWNITWWWNKSYPYPILTLGWFSGFIATLIEVTLQDQHIPSLDTSMISPNVCTDSTHSSTLGFTHSCFYFYNLCYPPMYKLLSINWITRP